MHVCWRRASRHGGTFGVCSEASASQWLAMSTLGPKRTYRGAGPLAPLTLTGAGLQQMRGSLLRPGPGVCRNLLASTPMTGGPPAKAIRDTKVTIATLEAAGRPPAEAAALTAGGTPTELPVPTRAKPRRASQQVWLMASIAAPVARPVAPTHDSDRSPGNAQLAPGEASDRHQQRIGVLAETSSSPQSGEDIGEVDRRPMGCGLLGEIPGQPGDADREQRRPG